LGEAADGQGGEGGGGGLLEEVAAGFLHARELCGGLAGV
jgi:hypothetical protein